MLLLAALGLGLGLAPRTASATTGGVQLFAWAEQENSQIDFQYVPNSNYMPFDRSRHIGVVRRNVGQYEVRFAINPFTRTQTQVVAYGTDNTRCKFNRRPEPDFSHTCIAETPSGPVSPAWCLKAFVVCMSPQGAPVNSKFVISATGPSVTGGMALAGPAAYFETTGGGTGIAQSWQNFNGTVVPSLNPQYFNSATASFPSLTRNFAGNYRVSIPGVGTSNPGFAQITAVGSGTTHCTAGLPQTSGSNVIFNVNCWAGTSRTDSDFIVNYDRLVTRQGLDFQGARAFADRPSASFYTPSRSFNSGAVHNLPGSNTIIKLAGPGAYAVDHTALSAVNSSPWVGTAQNDGTYCKLRSWTPGWGSGATVDVRCFNAQGSAADTMFFETYQGPTMGPQ